MTTMRRLLLAAALLGSIGRAQAIEFVNTQQYLLAPDERITNQLVLSAESVVLEGAAEDDLFIFAGQQIDLRGETLGDAWLAGSSIQVSGQGRDHVRAAAQLFTLRGSLDRGLAALGATVRLETNAVVRGDAVLAGESVIVEGRVEGDLQVLAQSVTLAGRFGGNARIIAQDIVVMPGASLAGDLVYTSPKEIFLDRNVALGGKLIRQTTPPPPPMTAERTIQLALFRALQATAAFLVGLPFLALFPRLVGRATQHLRHSLWRTLLAGLGGILVLPMAALLAFVTIVGIPFALVLGASFAILLYVGKIIVAVTIGALLLRRRGPQPLPVALGAMALGLVLYYALAALPGFGQTLSLLVGILGLGALLLAVLRSEGRPSNPPDLPPAAGAPGPQSERQP